MQEISANECRLAGLTNNRNEENVDSTTHDAVIGGTLESKTADDPVAALASCSLLPLEIGSSSLRQVLSVLYIHGGRDQLRDCFALPPFAAI